MDDREFALFAAELEATFRGGLPEDREVAIRRYFGRVSLERARECMEWLVLREQVFVPAAGELVKALRRLTDGPWQFECALAGQTTEERREMLMAQQRRRLADRAPVAELPSGEPRTISGDE